MLLIGENEMTLKTYTLTEHQLYTILNRTYKAACMDHYTDLSQADFEELKSRFTEELKETK